MGKQKVIRIGTRGSQLAVEQTGQVIAALKQKYPELNIERVILHTKGDKILDKPLVDFGGKGVFITEFEQALQQGEIDLAVHSAKDMPMELSDSLTIAGVLPRADARDVLVTRKGALDVSLAPGVIGTGSLRRQFQLKAIYPAVQCISIRGNVPTRLQKVRDGVCDGAVLAAAGLERLGLLAEPDFDYHYFSTEEMIPAGGQGIIAIESRSGDEITSLVGSISDTKTEMELETERKILECLNAGCHEAIGAFSLVAKEQIEIQLIQEKYGRIYKEQGKSDVGKRLELAEQLAGKLRESH